MVCGPGMSLRVTPWQGDGFWGPGESQPALHGVWGSGGPVTAAAIGLRLWGLTSVGDSNWGGWDPRGRLGVSPAAGRIPTVHMLIFIYIYGYTSGPLTYSGIMKQDEAMGAVCLGEGCFCLCAVWLAACMFTYVVCVCSAYVSGEYAFSLATG